MNTHTKRRARPVRISEPKKGGLRRLLLYIGAALGFAAVGFAATLGGGSSGPQVSSFPVAGRPSAVVSSGGEIYVADDQAQVVRVLSASSGRVRDVIRVSREPIALASAGGSVFVAHATGDISKISGGRVAGRIHAGASITDVAFDGKRVWAADLGRRQLLEVDPVHLRVVKRVDHIATVRLVATNQAVWATTQDDEVVRYLPKTGRIHRVHVGPGPIGLAIAGKFIWTANTDDGTLTKIDATHMRVVGRPIHVGRGPTNVVVRGGVVSVSNNDDRTISRIDTHSGRTIGTPIAIDTDIRGLNGGWVVGTDPSRVVRLSE